MNRTFESHNHKFRLALLSLSVTWPFLSCLATAAETLQLKPGENRIVFIGDSLVEQEQFRGDIEARLMHRFPDRRLVCRNLGWSGDDVQGNARTPGFNNPATFDRLLKQTTELKPDVIFVGYGTFESFGGAAALPRFTEGYKHLLDALTQVAPRLVLLSPAPQEDLGRPLPDPTEHNKDVEAFTGAIQSIATERHLPFVDLFHPLSKAQKAHPENHLTDNGIALNDAGYHAIGIEVERQLGIDRSAAEAALTADGKITGAVGLKITDVDPSNGQLKFRLQPDDSSPGGAGATFHLKVAGLAPGDWSVQLDDSQVATGSAELLASGLVLPADPDTNRFEQLRTTIVHRNEIYYRRWHPWNDHPRHYTYLEKDYPLYDRTISDLDNQIAALAQAAPHVCQIVPAALSDDPESERKLLELSQGLDIQLFASEPILQRPVTMNFDAQGRLWVLCIPRYPQILPGQEPTDYITVLEDRAGTGHADTSHTFVSGLRVATGMMPDNDNGVYVGEGDLLLHFKDTKSTGSADERRVVYTGFGTGDTHHTLNTFRWGNDGFLYFNQGWYINSSVETPWGPRRRFTGCIWQMRPDSLRLEVYDRSISVNNTWGHIFDYWGQSIISSPWPADINLVLPDTPLNRESDDTHELSPPMNLTKIAGERLSGLELVTGRHFPADWQNNLIAGGFNSQRVYRYRLEDDGQHTRATELAPLIVGHHSKFRPIDVKIGPDGALYILDWYNIIIQHNQVDFHDPRRDHTHGRIWRVTFKNRPTVPRPKLVDATIPELLDRLKDPEQWTRIAAKQLLGLRDHAQVASELAKWTASISSSDPDADHQLLEALWTYQTINLVQPALLERLLKSSLPRARAAAITMVGYWADRLQDPAALVATAAADPNLHVRLNAVLAAQRIQSPQAAAAGLLALDQPIDDMLRFELHKLAIVLEPYWFPALASGQFSFAKVDHELFALEAIPPEQSIPRLLALLKSGKVAHDRQADLMTRIAARGSAEQRAVILDAALAPDSFSTDERAALLDALTQATRGQGQRPAGSLDRVAPLVTRDDALGAAAIRACTVWKIDAARPALLSLVIDARSISSRRRTAIEALVELGGPAAFSDLQRLTSSDQPYPVRVDALSGMASIDARSAAGPAATFFHKKLPAGADPSPLFAVLIRRDGGPEALIDALKQTRPDPDVAKLCLRQLYGAGASIPGMAEALGASNAMTDRKSKFNPQEQQRLVQLALTQGDPARGQTIFRGSIGCTQCHAIAGAGGNVAPDLAVIGTTAQPDFLVEHLIIPTKSIKDGFAAFTVVTQSGDSYTGIRVREDDHEMVLRDATHDQIVIDKAQIKKRRDIGTLMPTGIADGLTDNEFADLVRFLIELGKPGAYDPGHAQVARQWLMLTRVPEDLANLDPIAMGSRLQTDPRLGWSRIYSTVAGELPIAEVAPGSIGIVRSNFEVTTPGQIELKLNSEEGVRLWIDGQPHAAAADIALNLPGGTHTLEALIDPSDRKRPTLRLELAEVFGSPGRAQWGVTK